MCGGRELCEPVFSVDDAPGEMCVLELEERFLWQHWLTSINQVGNGDSSVNDGSMLSLSYEQHWLMSLCQA
jgi:hypothetical protein